MPWIFFTTQKRDFTIVTSDICLYQRAKTSVNRTGRKYSGRGASAGSWRQYHGSWPGYPRTSLPVNAIWRSIYC
uniref:Uncharacterized protein n=1 Tax=Yersinia enterocolitica TaxID=630 RepID=B0RKQ8_YEREN|nr:hypothetical protein [Yersinia enterocolitica]